MDFPLSLDNLVQYSLLSELLDPLIKERCKLYEDEKCFGFTDWNFSYKDRSITMHFESRYYRDVTLAEFIENNTPEKVRAYLIHRKQIGDIQMKEIVARNRAKRNLGIIKKEE